VELGHQVEARQRDPEAVPQAPAHLALDQHLAGEQPEPQAQLGLVVVRPLGHLGLRIERDRQLVHHTSPPATARVVPVTAPACAQHRNSTAAATSSGGTSRPSGLGFSMAASVSSTERPVFAAMRATLSRTSFVSVSPGQTALTVTPVRAVSSASARTRPTTACLAAQ